MNNEIPEFEYKPEYREEMKHILLRRRRKRIFLWYFLPGMLIAVTITSVFYSPNNDALVNVPTKEIQNTIKKETPLNAKENLKILPIEKTIVATEKKENQKKKENIIVLYPKKTNEEKNISKEDLAKNAEEILTINSNTKNNPEVDATIQKTQENTIDSAINDIHSIEEEIAHAMDSLATTPVLNEENIKTDTSANTENQERKNTDLTKLKLLYDINVYGGALYNNTFGSGAYNNGGVVSFRGGINISKEISNNLYLSAGLEYTFYNNLYRYGGNDSTKLNLLAPKVVGYDEIVFERVTYHKNIYSGSVAVPVALKYKIGAASFSAGMNLEYFVHNKVLSGVDTVKSGVNNLGWETKAFLSKTGKEIILNNDFSGINRFQAHAFIGGEYKFSRYFSVGSRISFALTDLTANTVVGSSTYNNLFAANIFLRYHL